MIASISSRAAQVASTTGRSLSSRAGSQSSSLSARSQGNLNQKRGLQDTNLRSLSSSSSTQWTDAEDKSIWGLTASAFATGGAVALYLASDFQKASTTTQCSSFAPMDQQAGTSLREYAPSKALIQRTVANTGLRRILTEPNEETEESTLKSTSTSISFLPKKKLDVTSLTPPSERDVNVLNNMEQVPAASINMIDVVEASVKQASTWEKKAKAAVSMLTNPSRYETSVRAMRGGRLYMEDAYCIHDGGRFAGVFDGHGGSMVSKYSSDIVYEKIKKFLATDTHASDSHPSIGTLVRSIHAAFDEIDDEVLSIDEFQYQGSTAVAVYVHEDEDSKDRTIISANLGDSRAVLCRGNKAVELTRDHKPDDEHEKNRIIAMGETIEWDSYCQVHRVKNLSLSRALGDRFAKPVVSGEVEIQLFPLSEMPSHGDNQDDFIVLASDGLWDVMTSQNCVDFVKQRLNPTEAQAKSMTKTDFKHHKFSRRKNMSRVLANEALRRGSCDNICVVVIWLNDLED